MNKAKNILFILAVVLAILAIVIAGSSGDFSTVFIVLIPLIITAVALKIRT